jgi:hypothetical protein
LTWYHWRVTPPDRRGAATVQIVAGIVISALLVWLAFRHTDYSKIWTHVQTLSVAPLLLAVTLATIPFPLRVPRWQLLLDAGDRSSIPFRRLWQSIAIGFAANNTLPARAGEVIRIGAASRLTGIPFGTVLSSVAIERVIDALTVLALLGAGLMTANLPAGARIGNGPPISVVATRTGMVCAVVLALALLAAWRRPTALAVLERMLPSGRFATWLVGFADNVLLGLGAMRDPRRAIPVVVWSLVIWSINALGFYLAFKAFHIDVPISAAFIVQGALMIVIAIPSTPGYIGVFETVIPAALLLYGVDKDAALACAVVYHLTTFVPITFLGAFEAIRTGTRLRAPTTAST